MKRKIRMSVNPFGIMVGWLGIMVTRYRLGRRHRPFGIKLASGSGQGQLRAVISGAAG
jgi:hypothetical protein